MKPVVLASQPHGARTVHMADWAARGQLNLDAGRRKTHYVPVHSQGSFHPLDLHLTEFPRFLPTARLILSDGSLE
jgi:hypothetical protein